MPRPPHVTNFFYLVHNEKIYSKKNDGLLSTIYLSDKRTPNLKAFFEGIYHTLRRMGVILYYKNHSN